MPEIIVNCHWFVEFKGLVYRTVLILIIQPTGHRGVYFAGSRGLGLVYIRAKTGPI